MIENRIADIESHSYSPCGVEFNDPTDIQRKSGLLEIDRKAWTLNAKYRNTVFGIYEAGSDFPENAKSIEAQAALYPELPLKPAKVLETGAREIVHLSFERQVSRHVECQSAASTNASGVVEKGAASSSQDGELNADFDLRLL